MQASIQNTFKNVVLNAWKERWSEQKWTMTLRRLLQPGNNADIFQMADVLFSQAFIGSTPNTVLLGYFNYGLKSGTFTFAAIITAISKHEDLQNVTSMNYALNFLIKYIEKINSGQILEDCMPLCRALLLLMQWLLRNIEQYLKGVRDVSSSDADTIIENNCATLLALTTKSRTASLLTIERFEESSVWSHIETDLAVIKNAAAGHKMQANVNRLCHSVSQLARCQTKTSAVFSLSKVYGNESNHAMVINMMMLVEGEWNKRTDGDSLIQQLLLIAQICNLDTSELCLDIMRACIMGFLSSCGGEMKHKWCSILFLVLPQHLNKLKSAVTSGNGVSEVAIPMMDADFESSLVKAFVLLLQFDSLLDMLDQVCDNINCIALILDQCILHKLMKEDDITGLKMKRNSMPKLSHGQHANTVDPNVIIKHEKTAQKLLLLIDTTDYISKLENLLSTFIQMSSNFSVILASAYVSQNVEKFAKKLMLYNDAIKSSTGENLKTAQLRYQLFDFTFFLLCQIARQYGKEVTIDSISGMEEQKPFLYHWIACLWPEDRWPTTMKCQDSKMFVEHDENRVQILISALYKGREQTPSLKKWHEFCKDCPKALLEVINAWQYGVLSENEVMNACDIICKGLPFSVRFCCLVAIEKYSRDLPENVRNKKIRLVLQRLLTQTATGTQESQYEKRYSLFKSTSAIFLSDSYFTDLVEPAEQNEIGREPNVFAADILSDLLVECRQVGWVDRDMLHRLDKILIQTGPKWFCHQLLVHILKQTRKDMVEKTASVVWSIFMLDIESLTICLLRHEIPHYLTNEADHMSLSAPAGNVLAQLSVSCLAMVLHNISLQQKACLVPCTSKQKLVHQRLVAGCESIYSQQSHAKDEGGPTKLRRLFSTTAEHDLAASAFSSILGLAPDNTNASQSKQPRVREPVLRALSYCLDVMHMSLSERQPGPHVDYAVYFVYLASRCGELVSQAVLQLMPLSMVTELTAEIMDGKEQFKRIDFDDDFDSLNFALSISDLGHPISRRVAANAVCQISLPT